MVEISNGKHGKRVHGYIVMRSMGSQKKKMKDNCCAIRYT